VGILGIATVFFATSGYYALAKAAPAKAVPASTKVKRPAGQSSTRTTVLATPVVTPIASKEAQALHVLNRLAFGPRPGDLAEVQRLGVRTWIEQQLQPETLSDREVEAKVAQLQTLQYSPRQLQLAYATDRILQKERRINSAKVPRNEEKREKREIQAQETLTPREEELLQEAYRNNFTAGIAPQIVGELQTAKLVRAVESPRQLQEVLVDFWSNHFNLDVNKAEVRTLRVADERDVIRPHIFGKFRDMLGASAKSPAMLVYLDNARSTRPAAANPRRVQRQQNRRAQRANLANGAAMQNGAMDAETPAMGAPAMEGPGMEAPIMEMAAPIRGGINENYARELMELHTLGVNGGYTQKDVQEVARALTGWTINRQEGTFIFSRIFHDNDAKVVMGKQIPAGGGIQDGETVLDMLAAHPSTARFLARKLCVRLVSDEPPTALVERAAQAYMQSDGDLRELTRAIVLSPEFMDAANYRSKIKSPFEFAVSAVRALGGEVVVPNTRSPRQRVMMVADGGTSLGRGKAAQNRGGTTLSREIAGMGQPLFAYTAPTGYPEDSRTWVSVGGLVARLNFALDLAGENLMNVRYSKADLLDGVSLNDGEAVLNRLFDRLLGTTISQASRDTMQKQAGTGTPDANKLLALVLGSPEFQRR
jgi:uncharacterized protein (DUF1800 family)